MTNYKPFGVIVIPTVVIYRYKRFGIFNCRGITIVHDPQDIYIELEKQVSEKTGHKKITILEHT